MADHDSDEVGQEDQYDGELDQAERFAHAEFARIRAGGRADHQSGDDPVGRNEPGLIRSTEDRDKPVAGDRTEKVRGESDATCQREAIEGGEGLIGKANAVTTAEVVPEDKPGDAREQPKRRGERGEGKTLNARRSTSRALALVHGRDGTPARSVAAVALGLHLRQTPGKLEIAACRRGSAADCTLLADARDEN